MLTDPASFPSVEAVRKHLLNQLLATAYPDEHQWIHATRWLVWIAHQLGTSRDLAWWEIPGWVPLWKLSLLLGSVGGLLFGFAAGFAAAQVGGGYRWTLGRGHRRLRVRPYSQHRHALSRRPPPTSLICPALATTIRASPGSRPRRCGRARGRVHIVACRRARGLIRRNARGQSWPGAYICAGGRVRVRYGNRPHARLWLPLHYFRRLLEDALDRQLLRQAGAVYQFRHAALQDHLAATCPQPPDPPASGTAADVGARPKLHPNKWDA
jgi:hypothetical protein